MTLREILLDTMNRFQVGDDSQANLQDVLNRLNSKFPESLHEKFEGAVATERVPEIVL